MSLKKNNIWDDNGPISIGFYPDAHCYPGHDSRPVQAVARWFADEGVDYVVKIGDFNDMPSLSTYDKGTSAIEGKRLAAELEYSKEMLGLFKMNLDGHDPNLIMTLGNHEYRLKRKENNDPELVGAFGDDPFGYDEAGYWVYDYLDIVRINGLSFSHAFVNPYSLIGSIQTGGADIRMRNIGFPHVGGHQHGPLIHGQRLLGDGSYASTLIIGCCHTENHAYWGNGWQVFKGAAILSNVRDGKYDHSIKRLDSLLEYYT